MGNTLSKGNLFDPKVSKEIINKVKGHSTIAKLCGAKPIPFNGTKEFTFTMDKEVDIVAENGAKSNGGATLAPLTIVPIKIEYGARVSDEFLYASEEEALDILEAWTEGFARKAAKGLDLMAFHGVNPRTGAASQIIGTNSFDTNTGVAVVKFADASNAEDALQNAIDELGEDTNITGFAFSKPFATAMSKVTENGIKVYPEFKLGGNPGSLNGTACDVNNTVKYAIEGEDADMAIVGDFAGAFKWGVAKDLPLEIIQYGNPDNDADLGDLKGHNQVYLRSDMYIGWGLLDASAFARVEDGEAESGESESGN